MRQVPHYLIIGNGKMAMHFSAYLAHLQIPHSKWARSTHSFTDLPSLLAHSTHTLLLISDGAILEFADKHCRSYHSVLIHFSGSFYHEKIIGAHPLMTFGPTSYTLFDYQQIPFIIDQGAPAIDCLLPGLHNPHYFLPSHLKSFYHALCVLSGNFTTLLWNKMFNELSKTCHIPASAAHSYLKKICSNLIDNPHNALTGPLARNDSATIQANLKALNNDPYQQVYSAFCDAYIRSQHECS